MEPPLDDPSLDQAALDQASRLLEETSDLIYKAMSLLKKEELRGEEKSLRASQAVKLLVARSLLQDVSNLVDSVLEEIKRTSNRLQ